MIASVAVKNRFYFTKTMTSEICHQKSKFSKWSINKNKFLRRSLAVYVSNKAVTKKEIFKIYYDNSFSDHFARARTKNAIRRKYFWSSILFDIEKFAHICSDCQRVCVHHSKLYNECNFILLNDKNLFHTTIMNFIIDISLIKYLYFNKICDTILILMNKSIKYAIYIVIIKKLNVKKLAKLF